MKKIAVISLGGSLIVPEKIDFRFLHEFKKMLRKMYNKYKFVVVCGGGTIARKYIYALEREGKPMKDLSLAGIQATRMNARFMMKFFGKEANDSLPMNMEEVRDELHKNDVVFCGALRYTPDSTSDGTCAKLAKFFETFFINITNISGLYTSNPLTNPKAKFISWISWADFEKRAKRMKYHSGQHFVLDQEAATIIREHKIKTFIIGPELINLKKLLEGKRFAGTTIEG